MSRTGVSRSPRSKSRSGDTEGASAVIDPQTRPASGARHDETVDTDDLVRLNLDKAAAIERWLRTVGDVKDADIGRLSADLSDLYAASITYQRLLGALLATSPDNHDRAGTLIVDMTVELRHLSWHIRSSIGKLERLAGKLLPDE
jgi:hypothetical protein